VSALQDDTFSALFRQRESRSEGAVPMRYAYLQHGTLGQPTFWEITIFIPI
jgi:hypothetical protein